MSIHSYRALTSSLVCSLRLLLQLSFWIAERAYQEYISLQRGVNGSTQAILLNLTVYNTAALASRRAISYCNRDLLCSAWYYLRMHAFFFLHLNSKCACGPNYQGKLARRKKIKQIELQVVVYGALGNKNGILSIVDKIWASPLHENGHDDDIPFFLSEEN